MTKHFRRGPDPASPQARAELTLKLAWQFRRAQDDMARAIARADEALDRSRSLLARCSPDVSAQT
jgi:hypothetical protein